MLDPNNMINISGGIVADPEVVANGKIAKFRIGVDYSASDKDSENNSGYFDVVYYMKDNSGHVSKNASFVDSQISASKMKKGTSLSIIGRLVQERWKQDGNNRSRVVIVAEHIGYGQRAAKAGGSSNGETASSDSSTSQDSSANIPSSF